jgi:hypothetical protein
MFKQLRLETTGMNSPGSWPMRGVRNHFPSGSAVREPADEMRPESFAGDQSTDRETIQVENPVRVTGRFLKI